MKALQFLSTIYPEIQESDDNLTQEKRSVLEKFKAITLGKINCRLRAYSTIAEMDIAVNDAIRKRSAPINQDNVNLGVLYAMLYCLLDRPDARKIWKHLMNSHTTERILQICFSDDFGDVFDSPFILETKLVGLLPPDMIAIVKNSFPQEAIIDDFLDGHTSQDEDSTTRFVLDFLTNPESEDYDEGLSPERRGQQVARLKASIARYL